MPIITCESPRERAKREKALLCREYLSGEKTAAQILRDPTIFTPTEKANHQLWLAFLADKLGPRHVV